MPKFDVTAPDGKVIEVNAPEGATEEQAIAYAQSIYNPGQKPERSWTEALVTDPLASLGSGIGSLAQLPGQIGQLAGVVGPQDTDTGLMGAGKQLQTFAESQKSEALKQKQAQLQQDIAKQEGFFNEASTAIKGTLTDPALLSSFLFEQVPNMIGSMGGGMLAKGVTKTLLAEATETALQKAAVRGAVGTNSIMQGADVGSGTYEQTYENLIKKGVDPTTANEQALTAARESALGATVASLAAQRLVPGGTTLEQALVGRNLPRAGGFARGLIGEGGSEAFEEGAGQFFSNLAQSQYVPETDLMKGVGSAAGLGGVLGGVMGGAAGVSLRGEPAAVTPPAAPVEAAPEQPTLALEDKSFKPVVFPDGTVAYTEDQVKAYEQQQFDKQFDPAVQFAKQLEAEGAKPLPQLPHYSGPTMYVMPDGSTITSPEDLKAYQEQQFQQKFDPEVQFAKQLEAAGAKPLPALPNYVGPTMYVMPDGSTITSPEELSAYEQQQFDQRISPEVQFAKQLEEQRAAEEARQKELVKLNFQRQQLATETQEIDAEQTALDEATYGKILTAKEQKILDNQNRQLEQRRAAAAKEAAKVADQERRAFLKAKQQELNLPTEIAPAKVEGQPDLFAPAQPAAPEVTPQPTQAAPSIEPKEETLQSYGKAVVPESLDATGKQASWVIKDKRTGEPRWETWDRSDVEQLNTDQFVAVPIAEHLAEVNRKIKEFDQKVKESTVPNNVAMQKAVEVNTLMQKAFPEGGVKKFSNAELSDLIKVKGIESADQTIQSLKKRIADEKKRQKSIEKQSKKKLQLRGGPVDYTPAMQQAADTIRSKLQPFLDKVGLSHVALRLVNSINNGTADGAYFRNVIEIALDAKNAIGTLRHETIHALKELGVFTKAEWDYLTKQANEKWINEFISKDKQAQYRQQYVADNGSEQGFDSYLQEEAIAEAFRSFGDKPKAGALKRIVNKLKAFFEATGNWLRGNGFNSVDSIFSGIEAGRYAPTAEAVAKAEPSKAPKYQINNAPPSRTTKTAQVKTAGKAVSDTVNSVMNDANLGTKLRIKYADVSSGLANVLAKAGLARFDENGQLRADLLHHAKAQTINLIKNMMVTGLPMINSDGTLGIRRSNKTLAAAQQMADKLNGNAFVKSSGLTGRDYVAEVALAKRAEEIQKDDKRRNAEGVKMLAEAKAKRAQAKKIAGGNPKEYHALMQEAARLDKKGLKVEAKAVRKEARDKSRGNITVYKALLEEARKLSREGYHEKNLKREYRLTPEQLAWANKQIENVPELNQIFDIWRENNHAAIDLQVDVGLLTKKQADEYKRHEHYIPLFKSADDLDAEGLFARSGTGAKSVPKQKKLVKGTHDVNVWENVDKQMARMVAVAYENQTRRIAAEQLRGAEAAYETNKSNPNVNLRFMRDGKEVSMIVEDPTVVAAFQSANYAVNPIFKSLVGGTTTALRYGALLNPMFWMRQIIRDPMHSTMVTQTTTTPFHSMKNFAEIVLGKETDAYRTLVEHGVIGEVGNTLSIDDYLKSVGKSSGAKETNIQKALHKLLQIHESSDAATRVAIYNDALKKAKAQGMSEEDAKNFAVMASRESINFAVQGNSPTLAYLRQMIPFLSASISSLDTVYRAATGYGLNAEEKRQVVRLFWSKAAIFSTFVLAYAVLYQDDDDYKKLPDNVKDNNFLFPIPSPTDPTKKVFIKIPTPFEIGFLLKTLPEASVRYAAGTSTGEEMWKSIKDGFLHNVPGNGIPVPQIAKPILENVTNYSFYTGKPIESMGESRLPPELRGQGSSEFAKQVGGALGYSPKKIDNLISGYFAEAGTSAAAIASNLIHAATGTEPPSTNFEEMWGIKSFVTNPNVNKAISDFYEINGQAQQTVAAFNDFKNTNDYKAIESFVADEDNIRKIAGAKAMSKVADTMGKIRSQIRLIEREQSISPQERRRMINELQQQQALIAAQGVEMANQLGIR